MLLIATDEAGYGPKLGPLVVVATAWQVPADSVNPEELSQLFSPLQVPRLCGGCRVIVDDSKAVYKSTGNLDMLHAVVSASHHWCGSVETTLPALLPRLAADDLKSIRRAPWLGLLAETEFLHQSETIELLRQWRRTGIELSDVKARVITAECFNSHCAGGGNKADLLSESTLGLVRTLIDLHTAKASHVAVYCDRHGGRKFYGGVLQHTFPQARLQVTREHAQQSEYLLTCTEQQINVCFTVKGDSFPPVALSSMHAKYLRERFMESFNEYFALRQQQGERLVPTAGYPVDAERFLEDVAPIVERERIVRETLVRVR